jgi:hypothetical protein
VRTSAFLVLILALLGFPAYHLEAQEPGPLRFEILPATGEAVVEIGDLFSDGSLVEALVSGLPLRIRVRIELWKDGFFDDQKGQHEWRASILFDPLTRRYRVQSSANTGAEVNTLDEVRTALQVNLVLPLRPSEPGRYYYIGAVEMETLSLSDLEELQRWLQGELAPVVAGEEDVGGALANGFRRVLVRMLGLPAKRFQVQSPSFRVEFQGGGGGPGSAGAVLPILSLSPSKSGQ